MADEAAAPQKANPVLEKIGAMIDEYAKANNLAVVAIMAEKNDGGDTLLSVANCNGWPLIGVIVAAAIHQHPFLLKEMMIFTQNKMIVEIAKAMKLHAEVVNAEAQGKTKH